MSLRLTKRKALLQGYTLPETEKKATLLLKFQPLRRFDKIGSMQIALASVPSVWGRSTIKQFYSEMAALPVDIVYVGETVCSEREVLSPADYKEIAALLKQSGKKVFISTLTLMTSSEQFNKTQELISIGYGVEANSIGVLNLQNEHLAIGSSLNIYNKESAKWFADFGAERAILPVELAAKSIAEIAKNVPVEVWAFGNIPCSISWRCYTARALDISQPECRKKCLKYPQGMVLENVENENLFIIDGKQILSGKTLSLITQLEELRKIGVETIRIAPDIKHTKDIVNLFKQVIDNKKDAKEAEEELKKYAKYGLSNGWFNGEAGIKCYK